QRCQKCDYWPSGENVSNGWSPCPNFPGCHRFTSVSNVCQKQQLVPTQSQSASRFLWPLPPQCGKTTSQCVEPMFGGVRIEAIRFGVGQRSNCERHFSANQHAGSRQMPLTPTELNELLKQTPPLDFTGKDLTAAELPRADLRCANLAGVML